MTYLVDNYNHSEMSLDEANETNEIPFLEVTELRASADYIRYYYVGTHFFTSALIPVVVLLLLNTLIICNVFKTSRAVKR